MFDEVAATAVNRRHGALDDQTLVAWARRGDRDALGELYRRHHPTVLSICRRRVRRCDVADELAQEAFVRLLNALNNINHPSRIGQWLAAVAKNLCLDHHRSAASRREVPLEDDVAVGIRDVRAGADIAQSCSDRATAAQILDGLTGREASLLREYHLEDRSIAEIADRQSSTAGSVKVRLHRARTRGLAFARASGLGGLIPAPLLRWLRAVHVHGPAVAPAIVASMLVPVLIGALATAPTASDRQPTSVDTPTPNMTPASGPSTTAPQWRRWDGPTLDEPDAPAATEPAPIASAHDRIPERPDANAPATQRPATVAFDHFDVPAAGRQVSPTPPPGATAQYRIGFHAGTLLGVPLEAGTASYDEPATDPIYEFACVAADAAPPPTYCERG